MNVVKKELYRDFEILDTWFSGKCNFMCLGSNLSVDEIFVYKNFKLKNTSINKILGVIINRELPFYKHVKHICKKKVTSATP